MVDTIKFSQMTAGGDVENNDKVPGLKSGANVLFNNPWTFLAPGTTAQRPTPSATVNYRLRFNTDDQLYEYYDAVLGAWTQLQESAFTVGSFVTYTADISLPDAQNLGLLSNGILKQTVAAGISTLNIAVQGTDYYGPGDTPTFAGMTLTGNLNMGGFTATNAANPVNPQDYATKFYVDQAILNGSQVYAASVASLGTVAQVGSGVGATLTNSGVQAIFALDGVNPPLGSNVLIKDTATGMTSANEGIYTVMDVGSASTNWVLQRATSYDTSAKINTTGLIVVQNGSTLASTGWYNTTYIVTVDTTAFSFSKFGNVGTVTSVDSGTGLTGGPITSSGTLSFASIAANSLWVNNTAGVAVPSVTSLAALTKTDDTNVTLTLGGTPATALINAASLTLGWTGTLAGTRGGTGIGTYTLGDTLYSSAANTLSKLAGNTTAVKQYLSQTGTGAVSAAPAWATIDGGDITGAALTKVDDTNVTLSLGGTPATALLRAASLTLGWTGVLSGTRGGTGVNNGASTVTLGGSLTTVGAFASTFTMTGVTGVTFPTSGTLATTSQIPSVTPSALTKVDDTNVTLTLGGTPTTALLQATSLTLGWTGQLGVTRGGTGLSSIAQGDLLYGSALNTITALTKDANATRYLSNQGTSNNPSWNQVNLANGVTGNLPVTNLNSGTSASSSTFWRGDGTWASPSGSGTVNSGTQYNLAYYAAGGTAVSGLTNGGSSGLALLSGSPPAWSTNKPITKIVVQTFAASGTYTITSGMQYAYVEEIGGGGGSGGVASGAGTISAAAGGGGAAPLATAMFTAAQVGATATVTIGAGGTAGAAGANTGGTGGSTSIALTGSGTITMTSSGGLGGVGDTTSATTGGAGGVGGTCTNADVAARGASGSNGCHSAVLFAIGGKGADSVWGQGGVSSTVNNGSGSGNAGAGFGSGASGAVAAQAGSINVAGTVGQGGYMRITEFVSV